MTYEGIDTVARISATSAVALRDNGISFVGRYLGPESWGKTIIKSEAAVLIANKLSILLCYETSATRMRGGASTGEQDGLYARNYAHDLGVPKGTVIFFAADYDVPTGELSLCESYIRAAQKAMGDDYIAGTYGPERVVSYLSGRGACDYYWQCVAWSNMFLPAANVRQYAWQGDPRAKELAAKVGFAVDLDSCESLSGLWNPEKKEEDHWYDEAMEWADEAGLMNDGRPDDYVTRAELATVEMRNDERMEKKIVEIIKRMMPEDDKRFGGLLEE